MMTRQTDLRRLDEALSQRLREARMTLVQSRPVSWFHHCSCDHFLRTGDLWVMALSYTSIAGRSKVGLT